MLGREEIERAVELQAQSYQLLRWLEKAIDRGVVSAEGAHVYATLEQSTFAWLDRHYLSLPSAARPAREDLKALSLLFSTYLENTFDLDANPGKRLYSPDAHCFCPCCSWMVNVPHLKPKKLGTADKKAAERLKRSFLGRLAAKHGLAPSDASFDEMLRDPTLRETIGLATYAYDLLQRLEGVAVGPATLALWRSFAWSPQGSPIKGFKLASAPILAAQDVLLTRLKQGPMNHVVRP